MKQIRGIEERLANYPDLRQRVEELLDIVEGQEGEILKADEVEERVDHGLRELGQQLIQNWAQTQSSRQESAWSGRPGVSRKEKKTLWWMTKYGRVEIKEQVFRIGREGREIRPFKVSAGVECRDYSRPLQRVMVDFGAEESFDKAAKRIKEHYSIDLAGSAVRRVTLLHAEAINQQQEEERDTELRDGVGAEVVIAEMDGSMVPIVIPDSGSKDKRKRKELKWEEIRLGLAHELGSVTPRYGATMGSVEEAVNILADCVRRAGATKQTYLHCLGDGAKWIKQRIEKQFGKQAVYLLDIYHVLEYLAAAAEEVAQRSVSEWVTEKKEEIEENRVEEVIEELKGYEESEEIADEEATVRGCIRYLENHRDCMDYKGAREANLPIGSGEVEGGHRSVIQQRLKVSGAWWLRENAGKMAALRVNRANGEWQSYWEGVRQAAA